MLEVDKVVLLENKEKYLVLDKVEDSGVNYYYIAKVNDTETDIENNFKLVTVEENSNQKVLVEVTGQEKLKEILPKFKSPI